MQTTPKANNILGHFFALLGAVVMLAIATWVSASSSEQVQPLDNLATPRTGHNATALSDGRILITGGRDSDGNLVAASEIFDPETQTSSASATLNTARVDHSATVLVDGRVLVAGGTGASGPLSSAEIFDPVNPGSGFQVVASPMTGARTRHTATLLNNGSVLIAGGETGGTAEIFDPATQSFTPTLWNLQVARNGHTATLFTDDSVLLAGGNTNSMELFTPLDQKFTLDVATMSVIRTGHWAFELSDTRLLLFQGDTGNTIDEFNPTTDTLASKGSLDFHASSSSLLANGKILVLGTDVSGLYNPDAVPPAPDFTAFDETTVPHSGILPRSGQSAVTLPGDKKILVAGGTNTQNIFQGMALFNPARIWTDMDNYVPGEPVVLSGSGWKANEDVYLYAVDNINQGWTYGATVTAGADGSFVENPFFIVQLIQQGAQFTVTAVGAQSTMQADVEFTDSPRINPVVGVGAQTGTLTYGTGSSATFLVTPTRQSNGTVNATFSVTSSLPAGVSASFSPATFTSSGNNAFPTSTLTVTTTAVAAPGTYNITVQCADGTDTGTGTATLVIGPKHITGSFTANNKVYDGTNSATVATRNLNGVVGADAVTLTGGTATFSNKTVANGKTVTLTGATLSGIDASKYVLDSVSTTTANITALHITGSFTASNKTYDGTTAATVLTRTLNGTIAGDVVSLTGGTATFSDKNVGNGKTVTLAGASLTGGDASNYVLDSVSTATANITKANATVVVAPYTVTYDGASHTATVTSITGVNGETGATVGTVGLSGTTHTLPAGSPYTDTWTFTGTANYNNTSGQITDIISAKHITGNFTAGNKAYDGTNSATVLTRSLSGVVGADVVTLTGGTATFSDKNVGNGKTVTLTGATLSGADAPNYILDSVSTTTANITAKGLTINGAVANNKQYDGNTTATVDFTSASLTGVVSGDTVSIDSSGYSASFATKAVGNAKAVTVTGVTLSGGDAGNYTVSQPIGLAADITARNLTISGAVAQNKVYDGNTDATVDFTGASLAVVVSGDTVTINHSAYSASFATKAVGNAKAVTVTGVTLSGGDAGNYTVSQPIGLAADITARNLTISGAVAQNKVYDGNTDATVDFTGASLAVVVSGDTVTINHSAYSASFATKTVGNAKAVTVTGVTLSGGDAGNYTVSQPTGLTADITAKNLTINGAVADNKQYDGNTSATVNFTAALLVTPVSGDDVSINHSGYSASFATKSVGNGKPVTVTGVALSGTDAGNYTVSEPTGLTADITAKNLTINGAVGENKQYDGNTDATVNFASASLVGVVGSDVVSINNTAYSASFATKTVGTAKAVTVLNVTLSGGDAGNYTVSQPSGLTADITAKNLTINGAVADNKQYDGNTDATVNFTGASLVGVVGSDVVSINNTAYSASFATKTVGTAKAVTVLNVTLSGGDAGNYTVSQPSGLTADITAKNLTINGAVANNKQYDGNTDATVNFGGASLMGVVSGDTVTINYSVYSASFATKTVANAKPVTVLNVTLSGGDAGNYTVSQPSGLTADITAKNLTINGAVGENKQYDGNTDATVNFTGASLMGVVSGDTVTINYSVYSASFATKTVANGKPVTVLNVTVSGGDAGNYTVSQPSGLTADITAKNLTINGAVADNKQYDGNTDATVNFTLATLVGVVTGDTVSINHTAYSASFVTKTVGNGKAVTVIGVMLAGTDAGNYTVSQPTGLSADITAKNLTINGAVANNKRYDGGTNATVDFTGASLMGVVSGDTVTINSAGYSASFASKTVGTAKAVTVLSLALGGGDAGNYTVSQPTGLTADITAKNLTINGAVADSKQYDGSTSATVDFTGASLSGVIGLDVVMINSAGYSASFASKTVGTAKAVTVLSVTLSGGDAGNYTVSQPSGLTADITAKNLTINGAVANNKQYDGGTSATVDFTSASLMGVVSGDTVMINSAGYSASFASKMVGTAKAVTVLSVTLSGGDAGNYTVSQPSGLAADITAKNLTINGAVANNKQYDGGTSATVDFTSASLSGVIGLDAVMINSALYSASFATKTVATGKPVTVTGVSLSGTDAGNYTVSQPGPLAADIIALHITGSFTAANKVYDGNTSATVLTRSLPGAVSGDMVSLSGGTATFNNKTVGTAKTVTLAGAILSGTDASNYVLDSVFTTTANITALHINGSFTANNKVYDGNASATVLTRSLSGTVMGDVVSLTGGSASFADKTVGVAKVVMLTGATLTGNDSSNYVLDFVATTVANITALHVTGSFTASNKVYDGNTSAIVLTRSVNSPAMGDMVSLTGGTATFADKNVGTGKMVTLVGASLSGLDAGNYVLDSVGMTMANISAATVTASIVGNPTKTYDGNTNATLTVANFSLTGVVTNDSITVTKTTGTYNTKDVATANTVTTSLAPGNFAAGVGTMLSNYMLPTSASGPGHVVKANATVNVTGYSVVYDGQAHTATYTITGVNGETGSTVGTINVTGTTHTPPGVYPNDLWTFTGAANYTNSSGNVYDLIAFNGVIGLNSATITSGDALIDSFDSAVGPYSSSNKSRLANLLSNGVITLGGGKAYGDLRSTQSSVALQSQSLVTGNVTAGTTISNSGTINGTATQYSPTTALVAPAVAACTPFSSSAGISGNFSYNAGTGDLTVSGGNAVTLANGTYCFHSLTLSGGSTLRVNGPVAIRLTGLLTASGGSFMNLTYLPANLQISTAYTGNNGVTLSGGSGAYLSVYAPGTGITLSGGSPVYGALLGKTLTVSGGSSIHYDIQLAPIFGF